MTYLYDCEVPNVYAYALLCIDTAYDVCNTLSFALSICPCGQLCLTILLYFCLSVFGLEVSLSISLFLLICRSQGTIYTSPFRSIRLDGQRLSGTIICPQMSRVYRLGHLDTTVYGSQLRDGTSYLSKHKVRYDVKAILISSMLWIQFLETTESPVQPDEC